MDLTELVEKCVETAERLEHKNDKLWERHDCMKNQNRHGNMGGEFEKGAGSSYQIS